MRLVVAAIGRIEGRAGTRTRRALSQARRADSAAASASATSKSSRSARAAPPEVGKRMIEELIAIANVIPGQSRRSSSSTSAARTSTARRSPTRLGRWRDDGRPAAVFIIGGDDGLAPALRDQAALRLAFGAATWPHQLVRGMLLEQIYRAMTHPCRASLSSGVRLPTISVLDLCRTEDYLRAPIGRPEAAHRFVSPGRPWRWRSIAAADAGRSALAQSSLDKLREHDQQLEAIRSQQTTDRRNRGPAQARDRRHR